MTTTTAKARREKPAIEWRARATALLKREMRARGVTYAELEERLGSNRVAVTTKIQRGVFVASWFLRTLDALGVKTLRLGDE
jgi:hypothetical protein